MTVVAYDSTVLDKYATRDGQTVLRVQVSVTGVVLSYRSTLDESTHQVNLSFNVPLRSWTHIALQVVYFSYLLTYLLSVQCNAWTEYKFTCVCPSHFLSTRLQVRPLNGFLQLIA